MRSGVMASERIKRWPPRKGQTRSGSAEDNATDRPFRIGEAAKLVGVEAYVLRFWETQFSFIRPKQSRSRHRYYTQADVEALKTVKRLLHTEGYTIAGARRFVREKGLDRVSDHFKVPRRAVSGQSTKERLDTVLDASSPDPSVSVTRNGVHRALREILEDLRALHKLLDIG
jgi:DNA-binding transcriptional MerR regulator